MLEFYEVHGHFFMAQDGSPIGHAVNKYRNRFRARMNYEANAITLADAKTKSGGTLMSDYQYSKLISIGFEASAKEWRGTPERLRTQKIEEKAAIRATQRKYAGSTNHIAGSDLTKRDVVLDQGVASKMHLGNEDCKLLAFKIKMECREKNNPKYEGMTNSDLAKETVRQWCKSGGRFVSRVEETAKGTANVDAVFAVANEKGFTYVERLLNKDSAGYKKYKGSLCKRGSEIINVYMY